MIYYLFQLITKRLYGAVINAVSYILTVLPFAARRVFQYSGDMQVISQ